MNPPCCRVFTLASVGDLCTLDSTTDEHSGRPEIDSGDLREGGSLAVTFGRLRKRVRLLEYQGQLLGISALVEAHGET